LCLFFAGILQLELKLVREENARLLAELTESRGELKQANAALNNKLKEKETMQKAICRQLHKTHDVLRKVSSTANEQSASDRAKQLQRNHHDRFHDAHK
jgi:septal ring factor EnvC (AmiA/AmiB activator)